MKTILTALALVATLGCHGPNHTHHVKGWAEKVATQWAEHMGSSDANVFCISRTFYFGGGDASANCSVSMGNEIYKLYCWVDEDAVPVEQCEQR